jgi:hypothetical protein
MRTFKIVTVFLLSLVCLSVPAFAETPDSETAMKHFRIGAGVGIPYGGVGVNSEYRIKKYASVAAGLGYVTHDGPGWALGAMFYPLKNTGRFNPRLTGYAGRVATIEWNNGRHEGRNGGIIGGGFEWRAYRMVSLDFDLFYIIKDLPAGFQSSNDVGASVGLGVVF